MAPRPGVMGRGLGTGEVMRGTRRRLGAVLVHGPSMAPTLRHGDAVLICLGAAIRSGDVVVGVFDTRPGLLVVKRAVRPVRAGWWLESDNVAVTDDSRRYGPATVHGRVLWRYWPPALPGRLPGPPSRRLT